jgi:hypothetical protein
LIELQFLVLLREAEHLPLHLLHDNLLILRLGDENIHLHLLLDEFLPVVHHHSLPHHTGLLLDLLDLLEQPLRLPQLHSHTLNLLIVLHTYLLERVRGRGIVPARA